MERLTKEQAIIISGFTGICLCGFRQLHEDVERRLGRPVWTHEFASKEFSEQLKQVYKQDFLALCYEGE